MNTRKDQALERNGMVVQGEALEVVLVEVHMVVVPVDPVEWQISVEMNTMPFLPAVHAVEVNIQDNGIHTKRRETVCRRVEACFSHLVHNLYAGDTWSFVFPVKLGTLFASLYSHMA
uniref:Uncharacterized protein MJ0288 n=1 Tax=Anthurium amnicola TaxID=1678845 RepID=A0A1D1YTD8_9ARAE